METGISKFIHLNPKYSFETKNYGQEKLIIKIGMGKVYICITVDWEGENLQNTGDLIQIRRKIAGDIPFTHFICPNYFLHDKNSDRPIHRIKAAIRPVDEIGLHIHCYRELIQSIPGLVFRTDHNYHNIPGWFENKIIKKIFPFYHRKITGRGVPLSVYNNEEIEQIIEHSVNLLSEKLQIEKILGFRAGGWIANDNVLDIVLKYGFLYDSSAVPPVLLSNGYNRNSQGNGMDDYNDHNGIFTEQVVNLWGYSHHTEGYLKNIKIHGAYDNGSIETETQPFYYDNLLEIPDNCALTDFCSPQKTVIPLINKYVRNLRENPRNSFLIVYGCHQEGDLFYKQQLLFFINEVLKLYPADVDFIRLNQVKTILNIRQ